MMCTNGNIPGEETNVLSSNNYFPTEDYAKNLKFEHQAKFPGKNDDIP